MVKPHISISEDLKSRFGLYIDSFKIYEDLYKLGVEENKSSKNIYFPKIPKKYYSHFIRGYFDGDGIAYSKGYIGFCGSYTLLKQIHSILLKESIYPIKYFSNVSILSPFFCDYIVTSNINYVKKNKSNIFIWVKAKSEKIKITEFTP